MTKELDQLMMREELTDMLCGKLLGSGTYRNVFACNLLPDYVVKIEHSSDTWSNRREYDIWCEVMDTPHRVWFAKIHSMSSNGRILLMERTTVPAEHQWPDKVPAYLADIKRTNFGLSRNPKTGKPSNHVVAHDYGNNDMIRKGLTKRLIKANWNEDKKG